MKKEARITLQMPTTYICSYFCKHKYNVISDFFKESNSNIGFGKIYVLPKMFQWCSGRISSIRRWSFTTSSVSFFSLRFFESYFGIQDMKTCLIIYVLIFFRPISKTDFIEKKNDLLEKEVYVKCEDCGRKLHQICVLHNPSIWRSG